MKRARVWIGLLLLLLLALGLGRLRFDAEILNLLPANLPVVQGLKLHQNHFANARELLITVSAPDADLTETAARNFALALRAQTNLAASVHWQPPWLEQPAQAAELIAWLWFNQPPELFGALTNQLAAANLPALLAEAREALATSLSPADIARRSYDPFNLTQLPASVRGNAPGFGEGQEIFASADGTFRVIFVEARPDLSGYKACITWLKAVKSLEQQLRDRGEIPHDTAIHYTGRPAFVSEIAGGMESDLAGPSAGTLGVIALLFYLSHRRWKPLLWLIALLLLILFGTLAIGGLCFGTLNVVSLGFASILLGLAEDFGIVLYQESRSHPELSLAEIQREATPGIFWSTVTTTGAFLLLNLSGLPGLAQLGSLVGIGIVLSAVFMLFAYLPPLMNRENSKQKIESTERVSPVSSRRPAAASWLLTFGLIACGLFVLLRRPPGFDHSPDALRPQKSPAYAAATELRNRLAREREPLWVLIAGRDENDVALRLRSAESLLQQSVSNHLVSSFRLPTPLWPNPGVQAANRATAATLNVQRNPLRQAVVDAGFNSNSLALTERLLDTWRAAGDGTNLFWPTNPASRWVMDNVIAHSTSQWLALGLVYPSTNTSSPVAASKSPASLLALSSELAAHNVLLSGWELLGPAIFVQVRADFWKVLAPMIVLLIVSLWLAYRDAREMFLSLAALAVSGLLLWTVMSLAGWSWNLLNLMALPLLLGLGVDYSIHIQLALRRHHGDLALVQGSIGRALWLAGATTVAGFASLWWSNNAGMASLGKVCATGIACCMFTSIHLLPGWWKWVNLGQRSEVRDRKSKTGANEEADDSVPVPAGPSTIYRAAFWRLGLRFARVMPRRGAEVLAQTFALLYAVVAPARRAVVAKNLLPVFNDDSRAAAMTSWRVFRQFGLKLVDLWRYEAGLSVDKLFGPASGWEHFQAAQRSGRGVLLLTPHLGNWEFGAPLLTQRGINLLVITLAEPGAGFTELRQAARTSRGIETLVLGRDPFGFVEVIRRLEAGAAVALLIDRPAPASAVSVELFGRPFAASVAAAELARATGCALLPVCLPRTNGVYQAEMLPEIPYDRPALRDPEARRLLTEQIMRAFEPTIRQHADQWYHFVPVWPHQQ